MKNFYLRCGFTLIELIMAIAVIAFAATAVSLLVFEVTTGKLSLESSAVALNLARKEMEKTLTLEFDDLGSCSDNNYHGFGYRLTREVSYLPESSQQIKKIVVEAAGRANTPLVSLVLLREKNPPLVINNYVSNVHRVRASLNLDYDFRDYGSGRSRFKYREEGNQDWLYTDWQEAEGRDSDSQEVRGLRPHTRYFFSGQLEYELGLVTGKEESFTTGHEDDEDEEPPVGDPVVATLDADLIGRHHARLNLEYDFKSSESGQLAFEYRLEGNDWEPTGWEEESGSGAYSRRIMHLEPGRYYFRAQLKYNDNLIQGQEKSFLR